MDKKFIYLALRRRNTNFILKFPLNGPLLNIVTFEVRDISLTFMITMVIKSYEMAGVISREIDIPKIVLLSRQRSSGT